MTTLNNSRMSSLADKIEKSAQVIAKKEKKEKKVIKKK